MPLSLKGSVEHQGCHSLFCMVTGMIKKIFLNKKTVPVPIPIRGLLEAVEWVQNTLVRPGYSITRVVLDSKDIDLDSLSSRRFQDLKLGERSILEIQVDSPIELAIQLLDTIENLASIVQPAIRSVAVSCWQLHPQKKPQQLDAVLGDLKLTAELWDNFLGIETTANLDMKTAKGLFGALHSVLALIDSSKAAGDWKTCAKVLLNKLEPVIRDVGLEAEMLKSQVFLHRTNNPNQYANGGSL